MCRTTNPARNWQRNGKQIRPEARQRAAASRQARYGRCSDDRTGSVASARNPGQHHYGAGRVEVLQNRQGRIRRGGTAFSAFAPVLHALVRDLKGAGQSGRAPLEIWLARGAFSWLPCCCWCGSTKKATRHAKTIYDVYLKSTRYINGWDLVDLSARAYRGCIPGRQTCVENARIEQTCALAFARERRIATFATFHYIRRATTRRRCASRKSWCTTART